MKTFMQLNISIKQLSHEKFENNKGRIRRRTDNIMAIESKIIIIKIDLFKSIKMSN
jgi:hypothetical protein